MFKLLAFSCFLCAAFAWVPPGLDRAGMAFLGAGFVALALGRVRVVEPRNRLAAAVQGMMGEQQARPVWLDELDGPRLVSEEVAER